MKLPQKFLIALIVIASFGVGSQLIFADAKTCNVGPFTVKYDACAEVRKIIPEGGGYTAEYVFPSINESVIAYDASLAYHNQDFGIDDDMQYVGAKKKGATIIKEYRKKSLDAQQNDRVYLFQKDNKVFRVSNKLMSSFVINAKTNSFKVYLFDDAEPAPVCAEKFWAASATERPYTTGIARQALETLINNDADSDLRDGYNFMGIDSKIKSITIKNKVANIDFKQLSVETWFNIIGCDSVEMLKQQVKLTLTQFPTIEDVKITVNGIDVDTYFKNLKVETFKNTPGSIVQFADNRAETHDLTLWLTVDILTENPNWKPGVNDHYLNVSNKLRSVRTNYATQYYVCTHGSDGHLNSIASNLGLFSEHVKKNLSEKKNSSNTYDNRAIYNFDITGHAISAIYQNCLP
ncbi:MAG TPA: GerMN domain-containing protein [Candidatus Paceibacterota bacterium]